jgi:hypothetical protein
VRVLLRVGSYACCETGPPFSRSYQKTRDFHFFSWLRSNYYIFLGLTRPARAGLELTTILVLSESAITRLSQTVGKGEDISKVTGGWMDGWMDD